MLLQCVSMPVLRYTSVDGRNPFRTTKWNHGNETIKRSLVFTLDNRIILLDFSGAEEELATIHSIDEQSMYYLHMYICIHICIHIYVYICIPTFNPCERKGGYMYIYICIT